ncbi:hypothetical protein H0I76_18640 [Limibaculum sp. M0105]|uniref:Uncharacterized protein n=1 Tax=Thermohalobaculum xanthum TaxID=2753746 RepID=A0A8J7SFE7_9RHOB|nr:hypothetical protein [Thermohalobaculum xanthum]MBK0401222.1 hypothetical protein [Thermohalobaculum xanthum]
MDALAVLGDTALDAAIESGALDSIPILGLITSGTRAAREIRDALYLRKIVRLLRELQTVDADVRKDFIKNLGDKAELERFGENILLILDRAEDSEKPAIVGRIIAAHIVGQIASYSKAMRLVAMVDRAYVADLDYLKDFAPGVQRDRDVAASLSAIGFLSNRGFDGGGANQETNPGGYVYELNEYGEMLRRYGLPSAV